MGCLIEFFVELFFEVAGEAVLQFWLWLMSLIIPKRKLSEKVYNRIKIGVTTYSFILLVALMVGLFIWLPSELGPMCNKIGKIIFLVSTILMVAQIILGIISKIIAKRNKIEGEDAF